MGFRRGVVGKKEKGREERKEGKRRKGGDVLIICPPLLSMMGWGFPGPRAAMQPGRSVAMVIWRGV